MTKEATVKLTSAIGIAGELVRRGTVITIPEAAAKDLLRRGKAEMATAEDETHADDESAGDPIEGEQEPDPDPAAAAKTGKKK